MNKVKDILPQLHPDRPIIPIESIDPNFSSTSMKAYTLVRAAKEILKWS